MREGGCGEGILPLEQCESIEKIMLNAKNVLVDYKDKNNKWNRIWGNPELTSRFSEKKKKKQTKTNKYF